MDRETRRVLNSKQPNIFSSTDMSINGMVDGQISITKGSNRQPALSFKKDGKLYKTNMSSDGNEYVDRNLVVRGDLISSVIASPLVLPRGADLTLDSAGTITPTHSFHKVDTLGSASSDNLDIIKGGKPGQILVIQAVHDARTIVVRDDEGGIFTVASSSFSLNGENDVAVFFCTSYDNWLMILGSNIPS